MNSKLHLVLDIETEARDWFVRLRSETVSAEDIAEWETWLRAGPAHGAAYDRVAEAWTIAATVTLEQPTRAQLAADTYDGSIAVRQWAPSRPRSSRFAWGAVAAAMAACIAAVIWTQSPAPEMAQTQQIITARAQHRDALLPDGSKVVLGGMTMLEVNYGRSRRTIVLQSGEALFRVVHETSRPFVVETALGDITAVGTAFDVNVGATAVVLSVSEGVVSFDPAALRFKAVDGKPMRVSAGERLLINAAGARVVRIDPGLPPSWTEGRLEYRNQALELVLDDVNRYSDQPIRLGDPALRNLAYTGTVSLSGIAPWALGLGEVFPLVAEKTQDGAIILKRKNPAP
jgi:transmembrane sensor